MPASKGTVEAWRSGYTLIDAAVILLAAIAVAVPKSRDALPREVHGHQGDIYIGLATVGATLLGFVVAAITILLTIGGRRLTKTFVASRLYGKTLGLFHVTAVWLALTTFAALGGLFVDEHGTLQSEDSWSTRWIWGALAVALIAGWRFIFSLTILKGVVDLVVDDKEPKPPKQSRPPDEEIYAPL